MADVVAEHELHFAVLGPVEVLVNHEPVVLRQRLTRALLLALLLRTGRTVSPDVLIDELYGDGLPANPVNALHIQVSSLRRALAKAGATGVVVTEPTGYRLAVPPDCVDAHRFETMVCEARTMATVGSADALRAAAAIIDDALRLWRGEPFDDIAYRDFAAAEIQRLLELRLAAVEARAEFLMGLGEHRDVVGELQALATQQPLREHVHELLILALYRSGRQSDALRAYETARRVLADELGLEPGPELQRLERAVLDHDPELEWAPPPGADRTEPRPGAKTAGAPRSTAPLPAPVADLLGREEDLRKLDEVFRRGRMVTLTGPAGVGKTRLAIEHARLSEASAWFVDLGEIEDGSAVPRTVGSALGLPAKPTADPLAGAAALNPEGLLVLDTCEHVVESAARTASHLLRSCPELRVLATSRRPLRISGEFAWPVPPLAVPDPSTLREPGAVARASAVSLFAERAAAVRPDFTLTADNVADVAAVCVGLDGLPLAIELAAGRLDVLSPAALRRRLHERFSLFSTGNRDAAARQRTLRAAVDWSYDLLEADERALFQRLSVLPGSFTLDLATRVGADLGREPLDVVASLVRQSLLAPEGSERFRMLDTVRAYGLERAGPGEVEAALAHLAGWVHDRVGVADPALRGPDQYGMLTELRADSANVRAALEWTLQDGRDPSLGAQIAARLAWYWHLVGFFSEADRWLRLALEVLEQDPLDYAGVLLGAGIHATALGRVHEATTLLDAAVESARPCGDEMLARFAQAHLGAARFWGGDLRGAGAALREVIRAHFDPSDTEGRWVHVYACLQQSRVLVLSEQPDEAEALLASVEEHLGAIGDDHLAALALRFRARSATLSGEHARAIELATRALERNERLGYTEGIALSTVVLGEAERAVGRVEEAQRLLSRGLALASAADHPAGVCQALEQLAVIHAERGERELAARILTECLTAHHALRLPMLTPGRLVENLVDDLLGGATPLSPGVDPPAARARLQEFAVQFVERPSRHSDDRRRHSG